MSQYPHPFGYSQYHGQYPPQPYAYPNQNAPGSSAPSHNDAYNPYAAQMHRDASQAAFGLNATHIPGLGIGATPGGGTPLGFGFAPTPSPWGQQPVFPMLNPNAPPPQTYGAGPFEPQPFQSQTSQSGAAAGGSNGGAKPSGESALSQNRTAADMEVEEGELSEGQFEDLYEPREYVAAAPQPAPKVTTSGDPSQPPSAADTPDGGFYGTDEDDGGKDPRGGEARDRSASYSPFLSPREIQSEVPTPQPMADGQVQPGPLQTAADAPGPPLPGLHLPNWPPAAMPTNSGTAQRGGPVSQPANTPSTSFKSLQEAKKEAQKAILRLWPLGVKYQNYIDEGFDEPLIKGLFRDLHLDMPKPATDSATTQGKEAPPQPAGGPDSSKPNPPSEMQPEQTTPAAKDTSATSDPSKKGEERKDRIARLLAAKAAKAPAVPSAQPASPAAPKPLPSAPKQAKQDVSETQKQEAAPAPPASAPPKSKAWGEKERLLQQKIAALQMSRAQKSGTDTAGVGGLHVGINANATPVSQPVTGSPSPLPIPTGPRAASVPQSLAGVQSAPAQPPPPIIGLPLTTNAQPNLATQRKRPVASDFVEFSTAPTLPKRPFGQPRKETSLIIDVSDVSDDEEMEMDMDMGSPVDETLPIQSTSIRGQGGPAIRDFPPLTDTFAQRQFSSPTPSVTPPVGPANNKHRETVLGLKEKAIQEMRRKIALAEARRKVKQSSGGSVTPNHALPTSELGENYTSQLPRLATAESTSSPDRSERASPQLTSATSSARLPKPAEVLPLDPAKRAERRTRLMSLEIPHVASSLQDKLNRLQELQDEQARLKAEIDKSVAEQKRLAAELEQLDASPPAESLELNGPTLGDAPVEVSPPRTAEERGGQQEAKEPAPFPLEQAQEQSRVPVGEADFVNGGPKPTSSPPPATIVADNNAESASEDVATLLGGSTDHSFELSTGTESSVPTGDVNARGEAANASLPSPTAQRVESPVAASDLLEQLDAANADETTPMDLDSQSSSSDMAEPINDIDTEDQISSTRHPSVSLPDQISSAAQPREAVQEIETETTREVQDQLAPQSGSTLKPYESALRYFRAYRFHPEYQNTVSGGLKSLTYSNRINPDKELCPYELSGEQCPANCEFQHFASIGPPDDQILLELGSPDDYSGEQKGRFIQGLRELLQKFKADKVKDFDTIARGIIAFRAQILGDKSKVLRLEGVTI